MNRIGTDRQVKGPPVYFTLSYLLEILVETKIEDCHCDLLISPATNSDLAKSNNSPDVVGYPAHILPALNMFDRLLKRAFSSGTLLHLSLALLVW